MRKNSSSFDATTLKKENEQVNDGISLLVPNSTPTTNQTSHSPFMMTQSSLLATSSLMDRLKAFLPEMAAADSKLHQEKTTLNSKDLTAKYDIEYVPEDMEKVIEMDLALGLFDHPEGNQDATIKGVSVPCVDLPVMGREEEPDTNGDIAITSKDFEKREKRRLAHLQKDLHNIRNNRLLDLILASNDVDDEESENSSSHESSDEESDEDEDEDKPQLIQEMIQEVDE